MVDLDKGKGEMPEYEVDHLDESDSDISACSLDSEFWCTHYATPVVKKSAHITKRITSTRISREELEGYKLIVSTFSHYDRIKMTHYLYQTLTRTLEFYLER